MIIELFTKAPVPLTGSFTSNVRFKPTDFDIVEKSDGSFDLYPLRNEFVIFHIPKENVACVTYARQKASSKKLKAVK